MKKVLFNLFMFALFMFAFVPVFAQVEPTEPTNWVVIIIGAVIAVIEIIMRAIPNPKTTGIIGLIINLLKQVSDYLNNK
ncbi:MAG: hypothetical protein ACXAAH_12465 [Promethearchaeota archaeon]|jgi:hypothetical protein